MPHCCRLPSLRICRCDLTGNGYRRSLAWISLFFFFLPGFFLFFFSFFTMGRSGTQYHILERRRLQDFKLVCGGAVCVYVHLRAWLLSPFFASVKGIWATRGKRRSDAATKRGVGGRGDGGEDLVVWDDRNKKRGLRELRLIVGWANTLFSLFLL